MFVQNHTNKITSVMQPQLGLGRCSPSFQQIPSAAAALRLVKQEDLTRQNGSSRDSQVPQRSMSKKSLARTLFPESLLLLKHL
jgi:hypothetical protein